LGKAETRIRLKDAKTKKDGSKVSEWLVLRPSAGWFFTDRGEYVVTHLMRHRSDHGHRVFGLIRFVSDYHFPLFRDLEQSDCAI
jgi:hypothetical protein